MHGELIAEHVTVTVDLGDGPREVPAYRALPIGDGVGGDGAFPAVVVIHHMPGWDASTHEIVRRFAAEGYAAICPNLHHRFAPGEPAQEAARLTREAGGVPDAEVVALVDAAAAHLRAREDSNGRVGIIGYCSGGRQSVVVASSLELDAAIDCYGGRVVQPDDALTPAQPVAPIDLVGALWCPLLGLFGEEDTYPSPAETALLAARLDELGKDHEFHTFPDAGHAFFSVDRPNFRVVAAQEGWELILHFLRRHLVR